MEPLSKIRAELRSYIDAGLDYANFRCWIAEVYADHAQAGESKELQLCRAIEWELADFSEGMISEEALRQSLSLLTDEACGTLLIQAPIQVYPPSPQMGVVLTGTSIAPVLAQGVSVGVGPALEYAS